MQIANIHHAKAQLSHLIACALAGEEVLIARAGEPLVRLVPVQLDNRPREGGQLRGHIHIADHFDEPDSVIEQLFHGS